MTTKNENTATGPALTAAAGSIYGEVAKLDASPCSAPVAVVEWLRAPRRVSAFIRAAGLGITAAGKTERVLLTYKPGEVVDEHRVLKAIQDMADEMDRTNYDFEIHCPRVIYISPQNTESRNPETNKDNDYV